MGIKKVDPADDFTLFDCKDGTKNTINTHVHEFLRVDKTESSLFCKGCSYLIAVCS